ncbi:MAG: alpha/beta hydrolase [Clostridia bacterium]|nr:alpha/beta hydrolase [Clostridia bacterium]
MKNKKRIRRILLGAAALLCALVLACGIYVGNYYHADVDAVETFSQGYSDITVQKDGNMTAFIPDSPKAGLIFYPGGKVEYTAYAPLMQACAKEGILCILVKMPCNLAVLDMNAAEGLAETYPQVETWYIGGHSLGGSMAASYAQKHGEEVEGVILLGSYSTADLTNGFRVLSIYGSEDGVMNAEKYGEYLLNLPKDFTEVIIDGGCHAGFALYGPQEGDGTPSISSEEQILLTAQTIAEFISAS